MRGESFEGTIETKASGLLAQELKHVREGEEPETILLVEDEVRVRRVMADVFRLKGYAVLEVENAEEALRVATRSVQLLVTDVVLPGKNGRDLARELRRRLPELKTILVSGYSESVALL